MRINDGNSENTAISSLDIKQTIVLDHVKVCGIYKLTQLTQIRLTIHHLRTSLENQQFPALECTITESHNKTKKVICDINDNCADHRNDIWLDCANTEGIYIKPCVLNDESQNHYTVYTGTSRCLLALVLLLQCYGQQQIHQGWGLDVTCQVRLFRSAEKQ